MRSSRRGVALGRSLRFTAAALLVIALAGMCTAAEPRDYAYLFVQGKLVDPAGRRPLAGITVRLSGESGTFEAVTTSSGGFVFEKLPVAAYRVELRTSDGQTIRKMRNAGEGAPDRVLVDIELGPGPGEDFGIAPEASRLTVDIPQPPPDWRRFWRQMAIFIGAAAALAL